MTKKRGFAALSPERHREIAAKGGRAVQASGKAHRFTSEEAADAGHKGVAVHSLL
jgi:general stress protein YciG